MNHSQETKKKQKVYYYLGLLLIAIIVGVTTYMLIDNSPQPKIVLRREKVDVPTDSINPQEVLNNRVEGELQLVQNRFKVLESFLLDAKEKEEISLKENLGLRDEIETLKQSMREKEKQSSLERKLERVEEKPNGIFSFSDNPFSSDVPCEPRRGLVVKVSEPKKNLVKHVNSAIPPGTTVRAVLVSSVDAPCGAYSSSDPQPVKLRIIDDGHLPKKVRAKLKGGIVIASAYGDLSSERLYIRMERLTQVKPTGDFIETAVTGFITGEDGKYGVRGTVVDKSAKLVGNAALSGILSGVNNYFQAYASSKWGCFSCPPGGYQNCGDNNCSTKDLAYGLGAQGGISGMDNAFNTLTDYYIKRAEFIKPVLQVNAGRIVDLTFSIST